MKKIVAFLFLGLTAFAQTKGKKAETTASPAVASTGASTPLPTKDTVESFLRHMFGYDTTVKWQVVKIELSSIPSVAEVTIALGDNPQATRLYITPDGKHAFAGEVIPFGADPFVDFRKELQDKADGPSQGAADAKVAIVEFSDLQCPHCKVAHPILEKLIKDVPTAKLIFQNYPLDMHPWAMQAAEYADCIGRADQQASWKFVSAVFEKQDSIKPETATDTFKTLTGEAGADALRTSSCALEKQTADRVRKSVALGTSLGVTGTPTIFINGRKISNVSGTPYDVLKKMVEFEATEGK